MSSSKNIKPQTFDISSQVGNMDVPFICDAASKMFVSAAKVMVIFQGSRLKSTSPVVAKLHTLFDSVAFVINDKPDEKINRQDVDLLKLRALKAIEEGKKLIILNSSFSNLSLNRYYAALAHKASYLILVIPPVINILSGNWFLSNKYQPLFCAWYLHEVDSYALCLEARRSIFSIYNYVSEFFNQFASENILPDNFEMSYQIRYDSRDMKSCVSKIFRDKNDVNMYFEKPAVKKSYGKSTRLEITAIVVTPYSIFARVKLNPHQMELFDMEEKSYQIPRYPSILYKQSLKGLPDIKLSSCPSRCRQTLRSEPQREIISYVANPGEVKYAQAHINLGFIPNSPVHKRNVDACLAAEIESEIMDLAVDIDLHDLKDYFVKKIDTIWYIFLKRPLTVEAFFTTCCKPQ